MILKSVNIVLPLKNIQKQSTVTRFELPKKQLNISTRSPTPDMHLQATLTNITFSIVNRELVLHITSNHK
jgi:hypothetical protein